MSNMTITLTTLPRPIISIMLTVLIPTSILLAISYLSRCLPRPPSSPFSSAANSVCHDVDICSQLIAGFSKKSSLTQSCK